MLDDLLTVEVKSWVISLNDAIKQSLSTSPEAPISESSLVSDTTADVGGNTSASKEKRCEPHISVGTVHTGCILGLYSVLRKLCDVLRAVQCDVLRAVQCVIC